MQLPFRWPTLKPPSPDSQPRLLTQGVVLPEGGAAGRAPKLCWLSRALYRCKHLPLAHVVPGERRAVLRNLLLAWAPFDQAEYRVAWQGDSALAVAWDRVSVDELLATAALPRSTTLWPETVLREPPGNDGLRVIECLEGVEAQVWRAGSLRASRWWPQRPDPLDAQLWLRSLGTDATDAASLPSVEPAAWRRRPWAELQSLDGLASTSSRLERVAVGASLVGFTALTAAQAHQAWAAYEANQAVQRERQRLSLEAAPVLAARERAESLAREAQSLADQMNGVAPLDLLQHLADVLPARGVTLKELELTGLQLRLAIELAPDLQRSALVKDLQSAGWLSKVAEARDGSNRGWVVFDATLLGPRAPASVGRPVLDAVSTPQPAAVPAAPAFPGTPAVAPDAAPGLPAGAQTSPSPAARRAPVPSPAPGSSR